MNIQELNDCSIVDIETTGLSPDNDNIIEIGALRKHKERSRRKVQLA